MQITVCYFADLRECLDRETETVSVDRQATVADVWQKIIKQDVSLAERQVLCAVNQNYASMDTFLVDGDELAFFPPVTGG